MAPVNNTNYDPKPGTATYAAQLAEWDADERPQQYAAIAICTSVATLAVLMRLYAQHTYKKVFALEDFFIVISLIVLWGQFCASIIALKGGAGLHQVRVMAEDTNAPHQLLYIYINYWIVSVLWAPGVMFIKLSILFLYRSLFLVHQRWFKIALWANGVYAVGLGIGATFVFIFQCWPVEHYWNRFVAYYGEEAPAGTCLPQLVHLATPQFLSTASDLVILLLPVPIILKLRVDKPRKIAVSAIFLLGCFTVGCGLARIVTIFHVSNTADVTWHNIDTVTFTIVECGVGIVCACLPASAPLYSGLMKRMGILSSAGTEQSKRKTYGSKGYGISSHDRKNSQFRRMSGSKSDADDVSIEIQDLVPAQKHHKWSTRNNFEAEYRQGPDGIIVKKTVDLYTSG
ncbi:hypothetical protein N7495_004715 [Penicillium taxi]|uniref:uncharacterized protein n=1 Tax=Penicillium taxi TaxID=168475 RepID=UPI002545269B|nr:uncharacterized protein N7495_004715 [Penicillium taxi]KAJ5899971.1 hypothetical protein N7495_004715 [Penicillium taxi]